ncbi:MAG: hypothetical protein LR017_03515 [Candidatus Pacebacteria bacterium]|nr:hypothetical protein [Candidatus Paceibacterota bacterium]
MGTILKFADALRRRTIRKQIEDCLNEVAQITTPNLRFIIDFLDCDHVLEDIRNVVGVRVSMQHYYALYALHEHDALQLLDILDQVTKQDVQQAPHYYWAVRCLLLHKAYPLQAQIAGARDIFV